MHYIHDGGKLKEEKAEHAIKKVIKDRDARTEIIEAIKECYPSV